MNYEIKQEEKRTVAGFHLCWPVGTDGKERL